jgi:hypothetical protein
MGEVGWLVVMGLLTLGPLVLVTVGVVWLTWGYRRWLK